MRGGGVGRRGLKGYGGVSRAVGGGGGWRVCA